MPMIESVRDTATITVVAESTVPFVQGTVSGATGSGPIYVTVKEWRGGSTMRFTERVTAHDERNRFLVVHRHAGERLADIPGGGQRVGVPAGSLGVHVDQAHLHCAERPEARRGLRADAPPRPAALDRHRVGRDPRCQSGNRVRGVHASPHRAR